jgi:hypothetical protein
MTETIPTEITDAAEEALRRWFHGPGYTFAGHNPDPDQCVSCHEAADVAATAVAPLVAEHIARQQAAMVERYPEDVFTPDGTTPDAIGAKAMRHSYALAARMAREAFPVKETADA